MSDLTHDGTDPVGMTAIDHLIIRDKTADRVLINRRGNQVVPLSAVSSGADDASKSAVLIRG